MSVPLGVQKELFLFCAWLPAINTVLLENSLCAYVCMCLCTCMHACARIRVCSCLNLRARACMCVWECQLGRFETLKAFYTLTDARNAFAGTTKLDLWRSKRDQRASWSRTCRILQKNTSPAWTEAPTHTPSIDYRPTPLTSLPLPVTSKPVPLPLLFGKQQAYPSFRVTAECQPAFPYFLVTTENQPRFPILSSNDVLPLPFW